MKGDKAAGAAKSRPESGAAKGRPGRQMKGDGGRSRRETNEGRQGGRGSQEQTSGDHEGRQMKGDKAAGTAKSRPEDFLRLSMRFDILWSTRGLLMRSCPHGQKARLESYSAAAAGEVSRQQLAGERHVSCGCHAANP